MELEPLGGPVYLTDPASFAAGQPWESYRWLRANDPVHFHPETDGPGFWAVTRYANVSFTIPATAGAIVNFHPSCPFLPLPRILKRWATTGESTGLRYQAYGLRSMDTVAVLTCGIHNIRQPHGWSTMNA